MEGERKGKKSHNAREGVRDGRMDVRKKRKERSRWGKKKMKWDKREGGRKHGLEEERGC